MLNDNMAVNDKWNIVTSKFPDIINRVTWGKAPPFGDDLSLAYLYMLCV